VFLLSWLARSGASAVTTALLLSGLAGGAQAKEAFGDRPPTATPALAEISLSELPAQAQETHRLVLAGGPFPSTANTRSRPLAHATGALAASSAAARRLPRPRFVTTPTITMPASSASAL
jgi:membrane-associated phospholipid phosphatase